MDLVNSHVSPYHYCALAAVQRWQELSNKLEAVVMLYSILVVAEALVSMSELSVQESFFMLIFVLYIWGTLLVVINIGVICSGTAP